MITSLPQEELAKKVVGRGLDRCSDCVIMVLPDHPTPIPLRTHTADPVPFAIRLAIRSSLIKIIVRLFAIAMQDDSPIPRRFKRSFID